MLFRSPIGVSIGLVFVLYVVDLMCRIIPDIEVLKYITPFYYSNGADLFSGMQFDPVMLVIGIGTTIVSLIASILVFQKRDIMA